MDLGSEVEDGGRETLLESTTRHCLAAVSRWKKSRGPFQQLGKRVERQVEVSTLGIKEAESSYAAQDDAQTGDQIVHGTPQGINPLQGVVQGQNALGFAEDISHRKGYSKQTRPLGEQTSQNAVSNAKILSGALPPM